MKKSKKSFLVLLLLCFLLALLPMTVFAEGELVVSATHLFPYVGEENSITLTGGEANETQTVRISGYNAPWYVTDGLVLHLDGIYNAGLGVHNGEADAWVDLSEKTSGSLDVKTHTWTEKGLILTDTSTATGSLTLPMVDNQADDAEQYTYINGITVEEVLGTDADSFPATNNGKPGGDDYVYTIKTTPGNLYNATNNPTGYAVANCGGVRQDGVVLYYNVVNFEGSAIRGWNWVSNGPAVATACFRTYFTDDGNGTRTLYSSNGDAEKNVSAVNPKADTVDNTKMNVKTVYLQKTGTHAANANVSVNALRIYNRNLSSTEIAQNAATDTLRYDTEGYDPFLGTFAGNALIEQFDEDGNAYIEVNVSFDENGEATIPLVLNNKGEENLTFTVNGQSTTISLNVMDQSDTDAARAVEAIISDLPKPADVTADNFDAIRSADGAFAALNEVQKNAVSADLVQKLNNCKTKLDESLAGTHEVTLTYDANGGTLPAGTEAAAKVTYKSTTNPAYSLAVPTMDRYIFSGWYFGETQLTDGEGNALAPWDSYSDATIIAKWTPAGTEAVPYEITTAEEIYALARILDSTNAPTDDNAVSDELKEDYARFGFTEGFHAAYMHLQTASYALQNAITLANYEGTDSNGFHGISNFMGHFDGRNHTITLNIDFSKYSDVSRIGGVFANVWEATIENIVLDGQASGGFTLNPASGTLVDAGLLVGYTHKENDGFTRNYTPRNKNTVIRNITNNATINTALDTSETNTTYIAAIVGRAQSTLVDETKLKLINCVNNGDFTVEVLNTASNTSRFSSLIGHAYAGISLEDCANYGDITADGARILVGDLVATGDTGRIFYKNCISAGDVTATEENVNVFNGLSNAATEADGNYIQLAVTGKAGEPIRLMPDGEIYTFTEDGTHTLKVPVFFQDGEKQGTTYSTTDYVETPQGKLYWLNISNRKMTVNLQTADATTDQIAFSSWVEAISLDSEEDLLMMQKAINTGDHDAITYLYNKAGASNVGIGDTEAQIILRSAYYKLTQSVTIDDAAFIGIGTAANYFGGHFDGGKNTITLNMNQNVNAITGNTYYGLFGYVKPLTDGMVEVKDLDLAASMELQIPKTNYVVGIGSLAGRAEDLTWSNVNVSVEKMDISTNSEFIGTLSVGGAFGYENGLIGDAQTVTINATINIQGASAAVSDKYEMMYIGGFAGSGNTGGNVIYSGGTGIDAKNSIYAHIGGIIGYSSSDGLDFTRLSISNTTDDVITFRGTGRRQWIGTLLGYNTTATISPETVALTIDENTKITGKFAVDTALATDDNCAGGLVGRVQTTGTVVIKGVVVNGDISLSAQSYAGGLIGYLQGAGATVKIDNCASNVTLASPVSGKTGMLMGRSDVEPQYTTSAYIKAGDVAAIGSKADNQVIAINVTDLTGTQGYSDQVVLFVDTTPAALAVAPEDTFSLTRDGKLSFDKVGTEKASFTWNGVPLYTSDDITVEAKELNESNVIITGVNSSYPVTGSEIKPAIHVVNKDNGAVLTADNYDVVYSDNTEVGSASIIITFKGNYVGTVRTSFEIAAVSDTFEVVEKGYTGTYDKTAHGITVKVPEGATVVYNKDGSDNYSLNAEEVAEINAGTYVVYFKAEKDGKEVTGSETIIIKKASLVITAKDASVKVNGEMPTFSYVHEGLIAGDVLLTEPILTTSATDTSKAGTYVIKANGADAGENYAITYVDGLLTIKRANNNGSSSGSSTSYSISTSSKVENGSISVSPVRASKNSTITITVKPDEGYELSKLTVTDKNGDKIKVTDKGNDKYTFTMPASNAEISASFVKVATPDTGLPFRDIERSDWYYEAVKYVYAEGMMGETATDLFSPKQTITRGMIVTILYRLENEPEISGNPFTDVAENAYYKEAIVWGAANGIIKGYGNGKVRPNDSITREQIAAILYRYAQYKGIKISNLSELSAFKDAASVSPYAVEAMLWAVGNGIMQGNGNGVLNPTGTATRAVAAQMMMNFCKEILK